MDSDVRTVAVGAVARREYVAAGDAGMRAAWERLAEHTRCLCCSMPMH